MTQALYRRYRPESFADVIGQEHVTTPLIAALGAGKVNHAYLFSGPRGCGKTTSARILARCLNCAQGPTPTPCGTCDSCTELARGGSGSLDVIEIDAASHGGVDDARDLRERATIGPVRDQFKVYVIDEAHMVSPQGFNALLKLVEEPPDYVKFVFATTEPDKVLQTIRSRTHHYSFRLVPPETLSAYLEQLCTAEGVAVGKGVIPLVVRAGQGSVRDSLSVLDQLMAGAGPEGVDYQRAVSLLGYTDTALLDEVVSALGQADGAALFGVVDRVIQSGHDPRQFVTDLLERLRDLIVLQAMGEAAHGVLRAVPLDQLERMQTQSTLPRRRRAVPGRRRHEHRPRRDGRGVQPADAPGAAVRPAAAARHRRGRARAGPPARPDRAAPGRSHPGSFPASAAPRADRRPAEPEQRPGRSSARRPSSDPRPSTCPRSSSVRRLRSPSSPSSPSSVRHPSSRPRRSSSTSPSGGASPSPPSRAPSTPTPCGGCGPTCCVRCRA